MLLPSRSTYSFFYILSPQRWSDQPFDSIPLHPQTLHSQVFHLVIQFKLALPSITPPPPPSRLPLHHHFHPPNHRPSSHVLLNSSPSQPITPFSLPHLIPPHFTSSHQPTSPHWLTTLNSLSYPSTNPTHWLTCLITTQTHSHFCMIFPSPRHRHFLPPTVSLRLSLKICISVHLHAFVCLTLSTLLTHYQSFVSLLSPPT